MEGDEGEGEGEEGEEKEGRGRRGRRRGGGGGGGEGGEGEEGEEKEGEGEEGEEKEWEGRGRVTLCTPGVCDPRVKVVGLESKHLPQVIVPLLSLQLLLKLHLSFLQEIVVNS